MHSIGHYSLDTNHLITNVSNWIDGAVICFFLIAGYLFKFQSDLLTYVKKLAIRVFPAFFLFSVVNAVVLTVMGKISMLDSISAIMTMHGVGAQLYFLPFLFYVSVLYALFYDSLKSYSATQEVTLILVMIFFLIIICLKYPTTSSTGSDYWLLPLYFMAFIVGRMYQILNKAPAILAILLSAGVAVLGLYDPRFFDLSGAIFTLLIAIKIGKYMPSHRLPGSGGIYLLHTPMINFGISFVLWRMGIQEVVNLVSTAFLTYFFCLALTLFVTARFPKYKWLILE